MGRLPFEGALYIRSNVASSMRVVLARFQLDATGN